jgi:hypothetical protein
VAGPVRSSHTSVTNKTAGVARTGRPNRFPRGVGLRSSGLLYSTVILAATYMDLAAEVAASELRPE